jgi:hypothetical protein
MNNSVAAKQCSGARLTKTCAAHTSMPCRPVRQWRCNCLYPTHSCRLAAAVCTGNPAHPENDAFNCEGKKLPGDTCVAICAAVGYTGSLTSTCMPDGTWSPAVGACTAAGTCTLTAAGSPTSVLHLPTCSAWRVSVPALQCGAHPAAASGTVVWLTTAYKHLASDSRFASGGWRCHA